MKSAVWAAPMALAALTAAGPSLAQDDPYAPCAATDDDAARLACFDTTYAREREQRAERREVERERTADEFGLTTAQIRERAVQAGDPSRDVIAVSEEGEESLTGQVAEVFTDADGDTVVLLANGQLWTRLSNSNFRGQIKPGWTATISRSWSGGYRMRFEGRSGFLSVKRLR